MPRGIGRLDCRPPRAPAAGLSPMARRGSVAKIGGRDVSISMGFQVAKTQESLRKASVCGDIHEMQAALAAASRLSGEDGLEAGEAASLAHEASGVTAAIAVRRGPPGAVERPRRSPL
jgi:hypothetical protein